MPAKSRPRQAQEVEAILRARLHAWPDVQQRLPAETDLAAEFGVSRVTVREALASLERSGMILRRQGLGTFVNPNTTAIQTRLDESVEFGALIRAAGFRAQTRVAECEVIPAPATLVVRLELKADQRLLAIRKVFLADDRPVIACLNLIPLQLLPASAELNLASLHPEQSIYALLQTHFAQSVVYQISQPSACSADSLLCAQLQCSSGQALFRLEEIGYNPQQQPVFYSDAHYVPGLICFQLVRKPIPTLPSTTETHL